MEQHQQGLADLLEIYHARQIEEQILAHLRRLQCDSQQLQLSDLGRKKEVIRHYEGMLVSVSELLYRVGDRH